MLSTTFLVPLLFMLFAPLALTKPVSGPAALQDFDLPDLPDLPEPTSFDLANATALELHKRAPLGVKCETTRASPRLHEIDNVVRKLQRRRNENCHNNNALGSLCRKIENSGNHAAVSMCGHIFTVKCGEIANAVMKIKNQCKWGAYAGGRFQFRDDRGIALHKK
ncbi:hypothetical protein EDC01DRAFT_751450 [Geopyxis carbonaria]|nr:hypothetical protein EDC01DRAFT_751450 [Geopyxis carbonaria]